MATGVDPAEVAKYREMMRNGGTMPSVESGFAPVLNPVGKRKKNPQGAGRFADMNAFVDQTMASLTRAEIATWFALFRFNQSKSGTSRASVETIAQRAGTSKRHTMKAIASLMERGLVERVVTGGINRGSSVYRGNPLVTRRSPSTGNP